MWLRDTLPGQITSENNKQPMARVMIYGHDSKLTGSTSTQTLRDLGLSFCSSFLSLAVGLSQPIILMGHSLGGLIIKEALSGVVRV